MRRGRAGRARSRRLSRALGLNGLDQQGVERLGVSGGAQLVDQGAIAQQARHARQCLEMVGPGAFGGCQQEDDIDRPLVDGVEVDRMGEPREQTDRLGQRRHARVRDGDTAADPGRTQSFALEQTVEQAALVEREDSGGAARQLGQQSFLPGRLQARQNGFRADQQIGDFHNVTKELPGSGQSRPDGKSAPIGASFGAVKPAHWGPFWGWNQSAGPASAWAASALGTTVGRLRPMPRRPSRRRSADEGMRMASRYLATVRRAISTPSSFNRSTMRSSDNGWWEFSPPTRRRMRERTDSDDTTTPGVRAGSAEVKKYFSSKMPRGVAMYLLEVTRLTVLSCSSVAMAMSRSTSGLSALTPLRKKASCWRTISRATFRIVVARCSKVLTSQLADWKRSATKSRSGLARAPFIKVAW